MKRVKKETLRVEVYSVKRNFKGQVRLFVDVPAHIGSEIISFALNNGKPVPNSRMGKSSNKN